ncbi:MAG: AAA family ATPase [Chloroflexi bacterium]|nr:AAA family ATPase [Chloroflexota bacterium]
MREPSPTDASPVERRIVSVLFADLVGFTTLSERLDAEDMATIQDAYFAAVRETIARHGGVLEKFIGDAAMAVFGIPRTRDDDGERAVRAGLALIGAVEQLGARLGLDAGVLALRVGINTGEVVHAAAGPDAGRVTGDTVNTAARLQTAAPPNAVLVGELTALAVGEAIDLSDPEPLTLKGKAEPVGAAQVRGIRSTPSRDAALGALRAPLLGRDDELAQLARVSEGRVTIVAPPGVGKSRLVSELATRAETEGRTVLRCRVRPQAATPYEPVAQLLVEAGARDPVELPAGPDPARADQVRREVARLLDPTLESSASSGDLGADRDRRFSAWIEALGALTAGRALTIVAEDVHWATGDLLAFMDRLAVDGRIVVATARPSILEMFPAWVEAVAVIELSTLATGHATELVSALVGDALPEKVIEMVARQSDGNPLFIEELLRSWIGAGILVKEGDAWRLTVEPAAVVLPTTVQAIYAAQLDDLPLDARTVARRASVAGRRFADRALGPLELEDRRPGLDVLRRRAFIAGPQPDPVSGDVYVFRHALLRDAGYASLARAERARLHVALARWLEEAAGDRSTGVAQLVAEHYADAASSVSALADGGDSRASLERSAADWFERAAEGALEMAAPDTTIRLLTRSVELTEGATDLARRRLRRGTVLADSAELDAAVEDLAASREALEEMLPDEPELFAEAAYRLGHAYMQQIRFDEASAVTRQALDLLGPARSPGVARLMALHAWSVAVTGRDDGAVAEAREARRIGETFSDAALGVDLLELWAAVADEQGVAGPDTWRDLEERAGSIGRWRTAVNAARVRAHLLAGEDPEAALRVLDVAGDLAQAHALTEGAGWVDLARAETLLVVNDGDLALAAADRAIALGERYAYHRLAFRSWMVAFPILADRGDPSWLERHERWWATAREHFPPSPSPYGRVLMAASAAWVARMRGEVPPADPELPAKVPPMSNPHFLLAREVIAAGFIEHGNLARAAAIGVPEPEPDWTPLMLASRFLVDAWIAAAAGDRARSAASAAAAVTHAERIGAGWWVERAHRST